MEEGDDADDEVDPLDAFMTDISKEVWKLEGGMFQKRQVRSC